MILYISNATDYSVFNRLVQEGKLNPGNQMQKFNYNMMTGLSDFTPVVALSALQYNNDLSVAEIEQKNGNVRFIGVSSVAGKLRKIFNVINLVKTGIREIKKERPECIICDAIAMSPTIATRVLSKLFKIPSIGIITDFPGLLDGGQDPMMNIGRMQHFDGYVLLTEQMNPLVNPKNKPHIVMEGLSAPNFPDIGTEKASPRTILYTGALWKHDAGIEYFVEGFIKANIENCELHFYGVGELVDWLKEVEKQHPQVKYMGCVTNDVIVKKQAEAALLVNPRPSTEEFCKYSFPSKTIEYMASGTPVLMTKLPGVPKEYFQYVYTIEDETAEGVCSSLQNFFSESEFQQCQNGKGARNFILENKSCVVQAKRVFSFMHSLWG